MMVARAKRKPFQPKSPYDTVRERDIWKKIHEDTNRFMEKRKECRKK